MFLGSLLMDSMMSTMRMISSLTLFNGPAKTTRENPKSLLVTPID
jgi:hypothetical protein